MSKWSYRKVAVVGAILSSIGLVAFVFSPNVLYAYFFYGVLNGMYTVHFFSVICEITDVCH
jgi:hypothetical protein